mmetsp:Transcript_62948/g.77005  ORF Transcript_62948/g.77005 Transcript_62948/m.77005 type:complete len:456 (-) Transcript_62948:36-1403(-)
MASHQGLQVVDLVVDNHIRFFRSVVFGNFRTGKEGKLLASSDLLQLWEPRFFSKRWCIGCAWHLLGRLLGSLDLLSTGTFQLPQLILQLPNLRQLGIHLRLFANVTHARLRAHIELHPVGAGEAARDFVPHGRGISTSPSQDGIALLGVLGQKVREVIDRSIQGHPAVMGFVVSGHLRERNVAARDLVQRNFVQMRMVVFREESLHRLLDLRRFGIVFSIQSSTLLGLQTLQFHLQVCADALVLQQPRHAIRLSTSRHLAQHPVQFLLYLCNASLPQSVVVIVRHQALVQAQVSLVGLRSEVGVDLHALVDVIEKLRGVLPGPGHDGGGAAWMAVHKFGQVKDFAIQRHPTILRNAVAIHFAQRNVAGDRHGRGLLQEALLSLGHRCWHTAIILSLMHHLDMHLQLALLREGFGAITATQEGIGIIGTAAPWVLITRCKGSYHCEKASARRYPVG